jgi:LysM repeat protein
MLSLSIKKLNGGKTMFNNISFKNLSRIGSQQERILSYLLFFLLLPGFLLATPPQSVNAATCIAQHQVKAGETLASIGRLYGVSWTEIAQANNLNNPNHIYAGQTLCIPSGNANNPPPTGCQVQHIVKQNENLYRIGLLYGLNWAVIAQANNLSNPNQIYLGQKLCIPTGGPTTPPPGNTIPTFTIVSVVPDQSVTIRTANFPANQRFDVLMGAYGTKGINGTYVTSTQSGNGGSFTATYPIPANLRGADRLAIRLQSPSGYYSFNWFFN